MPPHSIRPPQSPVWHVPSLLVSKLHPVRAHTRPDHPGGPRIQAVCPESSRKPIVGSWGVPAPANVPGQIGWGQLLDMVKVQPSEILNRRANIGIKANTLEVERVGAMR
ncbi:hypothetical protein B296_00058417 [Ensete ventricosum]|uniref:Uncharacterized protein n=1 Tax=Ensete ventricosum TaxID=4639 RepID=A0A426XME8_ENSVE|nr:hypothetical protein B296_00058417 [Ensete ventricosum]